MKPLSESVAEPDTLLKTVNETKEMRVFFNEPLEEDDELPDQAPARRADFNSQMSQIHIDFEPKVTRSTSVYDPQAVDDQVPAARGDFEPQLSQIHIDFDSTI